MYSLELHIQPTQWYNILRGNHLVQLRGLLQKSSMQKLFEVLPIRCFVGSALYGPLCMPPTSHSFIHTSISKNKLSMTTKLGRKVTTSCETMIHIGFPRLKICVCGRTRQPPVYGCGLQPKTNNDTGVVMIYIARPHDHMNLPG